MNLKGDPLIEPDGGKSILLAEKSVRILVETQVLVGGSGNYRLLQDVPTSFCLSWCSLVTWLYAWQKPAMSANDGGSLPNPHRLLSLGLQRDFSDRL